MKMNIRNTLLLLSLLLFIGCTPKEENVTKAEALKFAEELDIAAAKKEGNFFSSRIIIDAFAERIQKMKNHEYAEGVKKGMKTGLNKNNFEQAIFESMGKDGSFERVKVYEKNNKFYSIFRLYSDNGLNYYDMELTKLNNKIGIADMFIFATGDYFSSSISDLFAGVLNEKETRMENDLDQLKNIKKLMSLGNFKEAKNEINSMPSKLRNTRIVDVLDIQISSELDDETHLTAIQHFEKKYGNDASAQLVLLDKYFITKEYDKAIAAINIIDSVINKDALLDYYRGLIYNLKGDKKAAILSFEKVIQNKPDFEGSYAELIVCYINNKDKQNAKKYFDLYAKMKKANPEVVEYYLNLYPYLKD